MPTILKVQRGQSCSCSKQRSYIVLYLVKLRSRVASLLTSLNYFLPSFTLEEDEVEPEA